MSDLSRARYDLKVCRQQLMETQAERDKFMREVVEARTQWANAAQDRQQLIEIVFMLVSGRLK